MLFGSESYSEIRAFQCQFCQNVTLVVHEFPVTPPPKSEHEVPGPAGPTESRILYPSFDAPKMAQEVPGAGASMKITPATT